ncbi:MAG: helix-turn-helix transcriptional regulator [Desulfobacterales bacterium]
MSIRTLREIRESLSISKTELAKKANVSLKTITRIEHGYPCRMKTKQKIALVLAGKISDETEIISLLMGDNGDRRFRLDRRQFSYDMYIPERRSCKDRRSGLDI